MHEPTALLPADPRPPAELDRLTRLIGPAMTWKLVERHAGTRVFVPLRAGVNQKLARDLSPAAEAALVGEYGGETLKVPLCKGWRARVYRARGMTVDAIALALGCTDDVIRDYIYGRRRRSATDTPPPAGMPEGGRRP